MSHLRVVRHNAISARRFMEAMSDEEGIQEMSILSVDSGSQRHSSGLTGENGETNVCGQKLTH